MTSGIVALVLFSALLHAGWNALIKAGRDKPLDTAAMHSLAIVPALPMLLVTGLPAPASWPFLAASLFTHIGYYTALAGAYKHGDLALTYPVMRGLAPLLVALGSASFVGEPLSATAWLGIGAVSVGVVALGVSPRALHGSTGKALGYAIANAAIIALYTVIDGLGVRASGNAAAYAAAFFVVDGIPYALITLWRRHGRRGEAIAYMASRWKHAFAGSLASVAAYAIALWAMTRVPVALVAALRETSVLFAALIGVYWLKEPFGVLHVAGTVFIVVGVLALRFG